MAVYRIISTDLVTGARVAEIGLSGLKYGKRRNGVGTVAGTLKLPSMEETRGAETAAYLNDAVDEARRHLFVERDGVIVADGIVWASPYNADTFTRAVSAASTWSYFRHRYILARLAYTSVDQFTMVRGIIDYAQGIPGGDIGVVHNSGTSGVTRDRVYESFEAKEVAEAVEQLAAVENGFDFAIDCQWDPATGHAVKTLNLAYPRRGRAVGETNHVFALGRNVIKFEWPSDGSTTANKVTVFGAGDGPATVTATAQDGAQIVAPDDGGPGYPLLEEILSYNDERVLATVQGRATARLAVRSTPMVAPKVTVRADVDPVLGSYIEGDSARFILEAGTDPRFPDGFDASWSIDGWDVTVDDQGTEAVTLVLV